MTTPDVDMAVQGRCLEEGIAFEIPVGRVQMTTSNGMSHEVSLDGKVFKMSNVWWLRGFDNPYLNISYNRTPPTPRLTREKTGPMVLIAGAQG